MSLDLDDIQGNIVRPYGFRHGGFIFVHFEHAEGARQWLGALPVMSAAPWPKERADRPKKAVNIAFTHRGLGALGVPDDLLATFPSVFRAGMRARAAKLGDVASSAPELWERGLDGRAHAVVSIHADHHDSARVLFDEVKAGIAATEGGVTYVAEILCDNPKSQREHFGFADGFGQPAIEGSGYSALPGQGKPRRGNGWDRLKPGEFVLGYEDEDGVRPVAPDPPLGANGSYMVLRKLEQNVSGFRRYLADTADTLGLPVELLAAKIVGRWKDGTPLVRSPDGPDPSISGCKQEINNFRYAEDPHGYRCPMGAHIRRTNPRDSMEPEGDLAKRHRMLRRGMPYGEHLPEGKVDDQGRGLVFVCYVASIERQYELVQRTWCNDGDAFWLGTDRDFIAGRPAAAGEHKNKMTLEGRDPVFLAQPLETFVTTKGGDYYFTPGLRALRALVAAGW